LVDFVTLGLKRGTHIMKVIFAGTPEFAVPTLQALLDSEHDVVAVLTQPDRPQGRGQKLINNPVKQLALEAKLPVFQPKSLKGDKGEDIRSLLSDGVDVMVVVAYGLILPSDILSIPSYGCINIHPSKLPLWRGAAPIQYSILSGDPVSAMTIMKMDAGMDTGDILYQTDIEIKESETAGELHDRMADLGAKSLLITLAQLHAGQCVPEPQNNELATYSQKIKKQDGEINWSDTATDIVTRVRAFNPWPVAFTHWQGERIRIWKAQTLLKNDNAEHQPGTIIAFSKEGLDIAAGEGVVRLDVMQFAGGKKLSINDVFNSRQGEWVLGESVLV
jgi:methionyl-tRNA formyltransferase